MMEFEYKGVNCVTISSKQATIVVDGKISPNGLKNIVMKDEIEVVTQPLFATNECRVRIDMPGEYEVSGISVAGMPATRMLDHDDSKQATMYRLAFPGLSVAIFGHVAMPLSDDQLEALGMIDVLVVPVGGNGYTLDSHLAVEVVAKIGPKVVIPTHYADNDVTYEVPQDGLDTFVKELGAAHEVVSKWKVKNGALPEVLTVIEITRTT